MTHFVTTGGKLNPLMDARQLVKERHAAFRPKCLAGFSGGRVIWHSGNAACILAMRSEHRCRVKERHRRIHHEAALSVAILERGERTAFEQVYCLCVPQ